MTQRVFDGIAWARVSRDGHHTNVASNPGVALWLQQIERHQALRIGVWRGRAVRASMSCDDPGQWPDHEEW